MYKCLNYQLSINGNKVLMKNQQQSQLSVMSIIFVGKDWKNSVGTEGEGELQEITGNIRSRRHNLEVKRKTC